MKNDEHSLKERPDVQAAGAETVREVVHLIDRGFCLLDLIVDAEGRTQDARYHFVNPAFERQTGLRDPVGRTVREVSPYIDRSWLDALGRVAESGERVHLVERAEALDRWFEVDAHRVGGPASRSVALLVKDVTERLRIEESLRASEARFRLMADAVPQIVWITDADGRVEFFNKRWSDYTGALVNPATAAAVAAEFIHPDDRAATLEAFEAARHGSGVFQVEHRIRGRDGSYRWFLVRGEPQRSAETGEVASWYGASTDIHDRRMVEAALARSEERLQLIVQNARDYAIFLVDPEGRITDWWVGAQRIFGWGADEVIGRRLDFLYTAEDQAADAPARELAGARENGAAPDVRWHMRKDGTSVFIEGSVVALLDEDGTLRGFLKIGRDATGRRAAEMALRESETRFRQFGDASGDLLWVRDAASRRFEYLSPACSAILGLDCTRLLEAADSAESWAAIVHPEDRDAIALHLSRLAAGERHETEFRIERPRDGEPRWLRDSGFPLEDEQGRVARIAGITADVSDEKETRERLKILVSELQHRTRNLLAVVQALAERTAQSSGGVDDFRNRYYPRLAALARVNELLSRLEADERVTFDQLVRAELGAHGALEEGQFAKVTLDGPSGIRLRSSTIQTLALALHELCTNSLKYGALTLPEGRLALRWSVRRMEDGERRLDFEWRETGVSANDAGQTRAPGRGFGRELIERALPRQLKTEVVYLLDEDGVRCSISLPLSTLSSQPET